MLVLPSSTFPVVGNGTAVVTLTDTKNINAKPGLALQLKQLFFSFTNNVIGLADIAYDAFITVNSEPVALVTGRTGQLVTSTTSGDVMPGAGTQFVITYDPAISIVQRDTIDFSARVTAKYGGLWSSNQFSWSYMLNLA